MPKPQPSMVAINPVIADRAGDFEDWLDAAHEHKGSWWMDWITWIKRQSRKQVPARVPGEGGLPPICDAPGDYVRVRY